MAKQWNYLASPPFQARYLLVAGLLKHFDDILEIGSYKTPIFGFVDDGAKNVVCVDPMVFDETKSERQYSVATDYRCLSMPPFDGRPYALVILGLDLQLTHKLRRLVEDAELVIIEFPEDAQWKRSREKFDALVDELRLNRLLALHLDLDGNDYSAFGNENEWPPRTQRYIHAVSTKIRTLDELGTRSPFMKPLPEIDTAGSQLLDVKHMAQALLPEAGYEFSHGAAKDINYLGGGLLYYTIAYMQRSTICVCLGSGGAFVPRLMRQAQRDLGMGARARTILVDGNKGGYGRPNWLDEDSFFRRNFPDVEVVTADTVEAAATFGGQGLRIDYLHIDADHSLEGSLADFSSYLPLMQRGSLVTFHDTRPNAHPSVTCWQAVERIRAMGFEVVNLDQLGSGVAIIKVDRPAGTV